MANSGDSFLLCFPFIFLWCWVCLFAFSHRCICTHSAQPDAHEHACIHKRSMVSQDVTVSFHIPEIGWIKGLLTRQGVGLSKQLPSSWVEQVKHAVSKEIFLNLKPEGSSAPMTVPIYCCIYILTICSTLEVWSIPWWEREERSFENRWEYFGLLQISLIQFVSKDCICIYGCVHVA